MSLDDFVDIAQTYDIKHALLYSPRGSINYSEHKVRINPMFGCNGITLVQEIMQHYYTQVLHIEASSAIINEKSEELYQQHRDFIDLYAEHKLHPIQPDLDGWDHGV